MKPLTPLWSFLASRLKAFFPGPGGAGFVNMGAQSSGYDYLSLDRGYEVNPWISACVRRIAETVGSVPLKVYRETIRGAETTQEEVTSGPLVDLLWRPGRFDSAYSLMMKTAGNISLHGEFIWYVENGSGGNNLAPARPKELRIMRSDDIKIESDPLDIIKAYHYAGGGIDKVMAPEFFVHGKNYNPLDDYRGLPAMKVAQSPVLLKWYMDRHNQMFFKDGARPDVIIKTPSVLKDDARGSLRDAWRRAGRAGQSRGVFLAEGNLEVTEWGVTAKDGEFLGLDKLKREEVLAIFGVPPVMVGVFEFANYANSTQQMRIFYEFTIKPICTLIQDSINSQLLPVWYSGDPGLYVAFDFSDIKPLQDDALKQAQVDEIQVRSGIKTVNEVRQDAGMAPVAWGDEPPAPATLSGLGGVMPNDNMPAKSIRYHPVTPKALVAPTRADQWKAFDRDLIRNERKVEKAAREFFAAQAARVIEAFDKVSIFAAAGIPMEVRAISVDDLFALFDLDVENQEIKDAIIPVLRQIVGGTGQDAIDRVGSDAIFNIRDPRIEAYFAAKELKVTAINTTTREMLRQVLIDAAADDATIAETARSIRGMFNDMSTARAEVIARTETISAQNGAAIEGYSQSGVVDEKEWLAVMDDATRDSHAMVDGTTTNLDGLFANGLAFPGDPNGPPEETINCRCAVLPVIRD